MIPIQRAKFFIGKDRHVDLADGSHATVQIPEVHCLGAAATRKVLNADVRGFGIKRYAALAGHPMYYHFCTHVCASATWQVPFRERIWGKWGLMPLLAAAALPAERTVRWRGDVGAELQMQGTRRYVRREPVKAESAILPQTPTLSQRPRGGIPSTLQGT